MSLKSLTEHWSEVDVGTNGMAWSARQSLGLYGGALALFAGMVLVRQLWPVQVLLVAFLLIVPGAILLRALRVPGAAIVAFPIFVPCASLAVLLSSGLAVDLLGPGLGAREPLRPVPLLLGVELMCVLLLVASTRAPADVDIPWNSLAQPAKLAGPLVIPLVAVAGALRLNSGHGHLVAILALAFCGLALVSAMIAAPRLNITSLAVLLYAVGLAMMWSFSLRGNLVYGFDIATEYYGFQHTVATGTWHIAHPNDAYGAMLSLTVLPTEIHALSGVSALLIFKLVYPAITALFPVAVFSLANRLVARRWAFLAAAFILIQSPFSQELPAIARQEIALLFFAGMLTAILDNRLPRSSQWSLATIFGIGMAVSHYSTTYFAVGVLSVVLMLQWGMSWLRPVPRITGAIAIAFIAAVVGAAAWYGPVTRSASNLTQFVHGVAAQGFDPLPNQTAGESFLSSYLNGNTQTPIDASRYAQLVHQYYEDTKPYVTPLADANSPQYALQNAPTPASPIKLHQVNNALSFGDVLVQQVTNILAAIGAIALALRRKAPLIARQIALFGLATLLFLVVIRFSGTIANAYNQERAFVQAMAVLSITLSWTLQWLANWHRRHRSSIIVAVVIGLTLMFAEMNGLMAVFLGGTTATNLANSGEDYERFAMTTSELASARWLGQMVRPGQLVYADRYAQLPLIAKTGLNRTLMGDVTPETIDRQAWIYGSTSNIVGGRGRALFNNQMATFVFPTKFLTANFNMVYTDGSSEVFYR